MAYTWIGSIRHARMDRTVNYAVNPVKTAYNAQRTEDASMTRNIAYALNPEKGTTKLYQTAINLDSVETAEVALPLAKLSPAPPGTTQAKSKIWTSSLWREMKATKERWGKTDGIQGFHIVQSFKPGEISPDLAHRIGVEFVEKCFPGFEAVVGTHLDHHHIHNHIVLNSVNCVDGHKYHSSQRSYYTELREVSDDLCRKYGLSIIPPDDIGKRRQAYAEWQAERSGQPTWCSAIKQDVDEVLARSLSFEQFVRLLREKGYEVKTGVKHMAVRPPGKERFTRLRRLGDDYTEEAIRQRILRNDPAKIPDPPKAEPSAQKVYRARYAGSFRKTHKKKVRGLMALYLWYAYRMGNIRRRRGGSKRAHYLLREDLYKLKMRDEMTRLLVTNRIETFEQLHAHRDECREMIDYLCAKRRALQKDHDAPDAEASLAHIREQLKALRREVWLCGKVEEDSRQLEEKRATLREAERQLNSKDAPVREHPPVR